MNKVATNALLERKGARTAFVTSKGFKDLLQIGNQARPKIFDLEIKKPELLYEVVVEVDERVRIINSYNSSTKITEEKGNHHLNLNVLNSCERTHRKGCYWRVCGGFEKARSSAAKRTITGKKKKRRMQ